MGEKPVVSFDNVSKMYKSGVSALNGVNLEINKGEFVYVVGVSGAGKSTLIKMLYMEEKPTEGDITIDGVSLESVKSNKVYEIRRKVGCVFQDFKLLPKKTVYENIAFVLEVIGEPKKDIREKVENVLEKMGMLDKKDKFPLELSGGQQQRVAIARALVNEPKILVADEPTGNLDPATGEDVFKELLRINEEEGTTIIMTTHNQQIVDKYKRRVVEIGEGRIVRDEREGEYTNE